MEENPAVAEKWLVGGCGIRSCQPVASCAQQRRFVRTVGALCVHCSQ